MHTIIYIYYVVAERTKVPFLMLELEGCKRMQRKNRTLVTGRVNPGICIPGKKRESGTLTEFKNESRATLIAVWIHYCTCVSIPLFPLSLNFSP